LPDLTGFEDSETIADEVAKVRAIRRFGANRRDRVCDSSAKGLLVGRL